MADASTNCLKKGAEGLSFVPHFAGDWTTTSVIVVAFHFDFGAEVCRIGDTKYENRTSLFVDEIHAFTHFTATNSNEKATLLLVDSL